MAEKLMTYDPAAALVNDEEIAFFLGEALETGDAAYIAHSLGVATRAKGIAHVAVHTGLSPASRLDPLFSQRGDDRPAVRPSS